MTVLVDGRVVCDSWHSCDFMLYCAVLLKDYLRELPDPLCTSSLYQMLMDALSVQVPDDDVGNAQLMFSILDCLPTVNLVNLLHNIRGIGKI